MEGEAEEGMKTRLCHAMQGRGVFVCFGCAAPVIRHCGLTSECKRTMAVLTPNTQPSYLRMAELATVQP